MSLRQDFTLGGLYNAPTARSVCFTSRQVGKMFSRIPTDPQVLLLLEVNGSAARAVPAHEGEDGDDTA